MFTPQDYIIYFEEITKIEEKMLENVIELKACIVDSDIQEILDMIYRDEQKHAGLGREIITKCMECRL